MCGRFVLSDKKVIKDKFNVELAPSYNIAPSQDVLVIKPDPVFTVSYTHLRAHETS